MGAGAEEQREREREAELWRFVGKEKKQRLSFESVPYRYYRIVAYGQRGRVLGIRKLSCHCH